jgi:hypothetical protein
VYVFKVNDCRQPALHVKELNHLVIEAFRVDLKDINLRDTKLPEQGIEGYTVDLLGNNTGADIKCP